MEDELDSLEVHPPGDLEWCGGGSAGESHLETYGGRVHVEWAPSAKVTTFCPLSYFIYFIWHFQIVRLAKLTTVG